MVITRDVEEHAVADLALAPPRAAMAVVVDGEIRVLPARVGLAEPTNPAASPRIVQVPTGTSDLAGLGVVLIADDGPQWFRLRSLAIRGTALPMGDRRYRLTPKRVVAWDYGALRQVPDPPDVSSRQSPSSLAAVADYSTPCFDAPKLKAALDMSRVMILASRSQRGTPFAVPLWFVTHRGRIYAATSASSWTVRNVTASPQVSLLFGGESGHSTDRLLVTGCAQAVRGTPPPAVLARMACRYYLHPRFASVELNHVRLWGRRISYYRQSRAAYVVITPQTAVECQAPGG